MQRTLQRASESQKKFSANKLAAKASSMIDSDRTEVLAFPAAIKDALLCKASFRLHVGKQHENRTYVL